MTVCSGQLGEGQEIVEVEREGHHREVAPGVLRPLRRVAVPVELNPVAIRVVEIERLAHPVIGGAAERHPVADEAAKSVGQLLAPGVEDRDVVEPGRAGGGPVAAAALPGVEPDVMVVAPGGEKGSLTSVALRDLEAEDAVVEGDRAVEIGDLEVDVPDPGRRRDGAVARGSVVGRLRGV